MPAGELAAIVAPSVACAREFVDLLLGLALPRQGTVRLFGQTLAALDEPGRLEHRAPRVAREHPARRRVSPWQ